MKYKKWSDLTWQKLRDALKRELDFCEANKTQPVAAFDADGTLWNTDLGENFFRYQIASGELKHLPDDPWGHYVRWKSQGDPRPAYLWLAQINRGQPFSKVEKWAAEAVEQYDMLPVFDDQRRWIELLQQSKVEIYIVTASVRWAVIPGAKQLHIPADHVLGVETAVENGIVTEKPAGFMTYREGKAQAIMEMIAPRKPFFCCGNTLGDLALLQLATRAPLAVSTSPELQTQELVESEAKLRAEAETREWLTHQF